MAYSEVQRRAEYLEMCSPEVLKILLTACLHNDADQRVNIKMVCKILKAIKGMVVNKSKQIESLVNRLVFQLGRNKQDESCEYLTLVNSDFYKAIRQAELTQLQMKLRELNESASSVEADLRTAMAEQGNLEQEENLMKAWFQLLSEKNDIIRRQTELCLIEQLEDLETKEYLLRKELRVLTLMNEDAKTKEQEVQEDELLQDLVKTVEQRNKIEKRKMKAEAQKELEAAGFAIARNKSTNIVRSNLSSNNPNNYNCVIS